MPTEIVAYRQAGRRCVHRRLQSWPSWKIGFDQIRQPSNLFEIVAYLQSGEGVRFEVRSTRAAPRAKQRPFTRVARRTASPAVSHPRLSNRRRAAAPRLSRSVIS